MSAYCSRKIKRFYSTGFVFRAEVKEWQIHTIVSTHYSESQAQQMATGKR